MLLDSHHGVEAFKASFTHFHQLRYVETYWNSKRTAGKAKSINFQTSHFQAAKLQRVPPEQFGPWSFNGHLHWHHFFPQNPESIKIQDWSRWVCLCLFLNSRFFGHISGFLDMVKNGWNEIEANPVHCSALTEWIWFRWHAAHWWSYDFLRCYLLLISYICRNTLTSNQFEIIRMWLQGKWRQFMSSADRCKVLSHREIRFDFVCNLSFQCFVHRIFAANTFQHLLHQASGTSFARRIQDMEPGKEKTVGAPCVGPDNFDLFQLDSFDSTFSVLF